MTFRMYLEHEKQLHVVNAADKQQIEQNAESCA